MIGAQTNVIGDIIKSRMIRGVILQETDGALNTFIIRGLHFILQICSFHYHAWRKLASPEKEGDPILAIRLNPRFQISNSKKQNLKNLNAKSQRKSQIIDKDRIYRISRILELGVRDK